MQVCDSLDKEFVVLIKEAEQKNDMGLVIKGNGIKRKCEEKCLEVSEIEKSMAKIEEKKRKVQ